MCATAPAPEKRVMICAPTRPSKVMTRITRTPDESDRSVADRPPLRFVPPVDGWKPRVEAGRAILDLILAARRRDEGRRRAA